MQSARVTSVDSIKDFRGAVGVFVHDAGNALAEIDADVQRLSSFLRFERLPYWQKELLRRQDAVMAARTARSRKELLSLAETPSLVEERKNLDKAKRAVEEALHKIELVKKWARAVDREAMLYKGQTQSLQDAVSRDLPDAMARLARMIDALEKYAQIAPVVADQAGQSALTARVMAALRGEGADARQAAAAAMLRRRTPPRAVRAALEVEPPGFLEAPGPAMPDGGLLKKLGLAGEPIAPGARVTLCVGALGGGDYYVERLGDDGSYHVGPGALDPGVLHYEAVTVESVLALRPGLREVLELSRGFLARVVSGNVVSVLNALDEEVLTP